MHQQLVHKKKTNRKKVDWGYELDLLGDCCRFTAYHLCLPCYQNAVASLSKY